MADTCSQGEANIAEASLRAKELSRWCKIGEWPALVLCGPRVIDPDAFTISFTGDFGFWNLYPERQDLENIIKMEHNLLSRFDLRVLNLEFILPGLQGRRVDSDCETMTLSIIEQLEINIVSLANNHAAAFGRAGIDHNISELRARGIDIIGLRDRMIYSSSQPGFRLGIYSLTDQLDDPDETHSVLRPVASDLDRLRSALAGIDVVIGFPHLGSRSIYPVPHERTMAKTLIEIGTDILVCTGSHFVKGFMRHDGAPVIYGLGNHWFTWCGGNTEEIGIHLVVALNKKGDISGIYAVPFYNRILDGRTGPLAEDDFERFRAEYAARSVDDPELVWQDPRMRKGVWERIRNLNGKRLRRLRWRHMAYTLKVLYHGIKRKR